MPSEEFSPLRKAAIRAGMIVLKRAILNAVREGYLVETTPEGTCRSDDPKPHHWHDFEPVNGRTDLSLLLDYEVIGEKIHNCLHRVSMGDNFGHLMVETGQENESSTLYFPEYIHRVTIGPSSALKK